MGIQTGFCDGGRKRAVHLRECPLGPGEALNKVLYGEAPPCGPNPYHFRYHF